jgi:23S rRNA pseudouridine2605 synthase
MQSNEERLQKLLARAGIASRRASEDLIAAGRVKVNGKVVTELGKKIDPAKDKVSVDDQPISVKAGTTPASVYIALHKPTGYLSTVTDPQGRPTIMDLVEVEGRIYPVGRLDADTAGLLILTNDGAFANSLMNPAFGIEKEYMVLLESIIPLRKLDDLRNGVTIEVEDQETGERNDYRTKPAKVEFVRHEGSNTLIKVILTEGKKRQVRLMAQAVGTKVLELTRVRFGTLKLGDLAEGKFRKIAKAEVGALLLAAKKPVTTEKETAKAQGRYEKPYSKEQEKIKQANKPFANRQDTGRAPARNAASAQTAPMKRAPRKPFSEERQSEGGNRPNQKPYREEQPGNHQPNRRPLANDSATGKRPPRKPFSEERSTETGSNRKPFSDRPESGNRPYRKPESPSGNFPNRKPFASDQNPNRHARKPFSNDQDSTESPSRRPDFKEREYPARPARNSFSNDRDERREESRPARKPFANDRNERPSEDRPNRRPFSDRPENGSRPARKPYPNDRPAENRPPRKPFSEERETGNRPPTRRPFSDRQEQAARPARKPFANEQDRTERPARKPFPSKAGSPERPSRKPFPNDRDPENRTNGKPISNERDPNRRATNQPSTPKNYKGNNPNQRSGHRGRGTGK